MLTFVLSVLFHCRSYLRAKVLGVFQINFQKKFYFLFEFSHSFAPHPLVPWPQPINVIRVTIRKQASLSRNPESRVKIHLKIKIIFPACQ